MKPACGIETYFCYQIKLNSQTFKSMKPACGIETRFEVDIAVPTASFQINETRLRD